MAAVQPLQNQGNFIPANESIPSQRSWNYSMPANSNTRPGPGIRKPQSRDHLRSVSDHTSSRPNGTPQSPAGPEATDPYHPIRGNGLGDNRLLPPASVLGRKNSSTGEIGSGSESMLDLYNTHGTHQGRGESFDATDKRPLGQTSFGEDEDPERSRWIHRDKLARIESEELQRAGIQLPRDASADRRRPPLRPPTKTERHRDPSTNGADAKETTTRDEKRPRMGASAAAPAAATYAMETDDEDDGEVMNFDLRTPEEAAEDPYEERLTPTYQEQPRWPGNNPSYSRIPLPKSSPIPIPQDYIERNTPLPRSMSGEEPSIEYKGRSRSQSLASQAYRDEVEEMPSPPTSPSKAKTPSSNGPTSGGRKRSESSGQKTPIRPSQSRDPPGTRPTTRSGEVKRPEGDPPWLASMYKPDPRLPPDQQLLPTVAKRLQQEQWEREGKFGNAYDRELNPMNDTPPEGPKPEPAPEPESEVAKAQGPDAAGESGGGWPLGGPNSPTESTGRPGTSGTTGTEHGGYKTMPTVRDSGNGTSTGPTPMHVMTLADEEEGKERTKGCGCCVVM
ncbi:MAG: hypothetical protein M1838_000435 [Thelocarpon superellum]|nr:MAG: hypothetical protein M1838_000435 [Thelocarpon superellum]